MRVMIKVTYLLSFFGLVLSIFITVLGVTCALLAMLTGLLSVIISGGKKAWISFFCSISTFAAILTMLYFLLKTFTVLE